MPEVQELLDQAIRLHQEGRLDEAQQRYADVLAVAPDHAEAIHFLGVIAYQNRDFDSGIELISRSISLDPNCAEAYFNLGIALAWRGNFDDAAVAYEKGVALDPDNVTSRYLLKSLLDDHSKEPPREFVRNLFNLYSSWFDRHLVETLEYKTPVLLRLAVEKLLDPGQRFAHALDLGCGTGLVGGEFRDLAESLSGVDLSDKMIAEAWNKHIYDALTVSDLIEFLDESEERFDLFLAADVFVYLGDLEPVFRAIRERAAEGAWFAFSTESEDGDGFVLRRNGRYAHSQSYVRAVGQQNGFRTVLCLSAELRTEMKKPVVGDIYVLCLENGG